MDKFVRRIFFILFLFVLIIFGFRFTQSAFFEVTEINISGDNLMINSDITNKLQHLKGLSIFYVNKSELISDILEDIRIEKVNVEKKYPNILNIEIIIRKPVAFVSIDNKFFAVDSNLNIFGKFEEINDKNIPIVHFDDNSKNNIINILNSLIPSKMYDITSEIVEEQGYFSLILDSGVRVFMNKSITTNKLNQAFKIYSDEIKNNNLEYMDLRFKYINVK
ncbi:cell division protein FtsQ/DivIB [Caviibacter abscessus]|uniref:cell division protein FtsQ/DivIB n=1 Tax=Caviibacter abscessus TaxID=1766719 RepID=UPI00082A1832|nr:FtsQ-type POTRA domain-containing protein [Caviibacter abscessus]